MYDLIGFILIFYIFSRSIYSELKDVDVDGAWIELTKDLVALGYSAWSVVAPVVASDSPEGHLPMDNVSGIYIFFSFE